MFIEQILIFALGFLSAGLLTLLFLPAFWRRAMTLSKRQIEMQIPLSMAEVVAERDQLRAEFAAEQRKLEQRLTAAVEARAQDRVELGRRTIANAQFQEELATLRGELEAAHVQLDMQRLRIAETEAELATSLKQIFDSQCLLDQRQGELESLNSAHAALQVQSDEQRTSIAGLETRLSGCEADIEALEEDLALAQSDLKRVHAEVELAQRERDQYRLDAQTARARREALQLEFEAQARHIETLQNALRLAERDKARMSAEIADIIAAAEAERRRARELMAQIAGHDEAVRQRDRKAAAEVELVRAGAAAAEGALVAQRRENETARAEIARLREELRAARGASPAAPLAGAENARTPANDAGAPRDFPALRRAIFELGQEIARVAAESETSGKEQPKGEPVRQATHSDAAE